MKGSKYMLVVERKPNSFNFVQFLLRNLCTKDVVLGINELLPSDLPVRVLRVSYECFSTYTQTE